MTDDEREDYLMNESQNTLPPFAPARGSGASDPLVEELRSLATTAYPLYPEARMLLEMALDAQQGKPVDLNRLQRTNQAQRPPNV